MDANSVAFCRNPASSLVYSRDFFVEIPQNCTWIPHTFVEIPQNCTLIPHTFVEIPQTGKNKRFFPILKGEASRSSFL
jgi:hypothetical protein